MRLIPSNPWYLKYAIGLIFLSLLFLLIWQFVPTNDDRAMSMAKEYFLNRMADPDSTKFRNIKVVHLGGSTEQIVVCGEINGKNAYGGYVGFVTFFYRTTKENVENYEDPLSPEGASWYNDSGLYRLNWNMYCGQKN